MLLHRSSSSSARTEVYASVSKLKNVFFTYIFIVKHFITITQLLLTALSNKVLLLQFYRREQIMKYEILMLVFA